MSWEAMMKGESQTVIQGRRATVLALKIVVAAAVLLPAGGHAQDQITSNFTPAFKDTLSPRAKAETAKADEATLARQGYIKVGTIYAEVPKSATAENDLRSAILRDAGLNGGDVVYFTESASRTPVLITVEEVVTTCERYADSLSPSGPKNPCAKWDSMKVGTKEKKVDGFRSAGTVWRYDPALPAYAAASSGDATKLAAELGNSSSTANAIGVGGMTFLCTAAREGQGDVAALLIEKGANVGLSSGTLPIGFTRDPKSEPPLTWAAANGHADVAELLISKGADVNEGDAHGYTPLDAAATYGHVEAAESLLNKGADVNHRDLDGGTPLLIAVDHKHLAVAQLLIAKGADVNAKDWDGRTPLFYAVDAIDSGVGGNGDLAELLLAKGADVNAKDRDGHAALYYLNEPKREHHYVSGDLRRLAKLLVQHGGRDE